MILTGEALRRENAQAIAELLAEQGGEFVCATAGHHMESMLAAYGSGAARVSHDEGKRILNIDIGGGTTKLALVEKGKVVATAAVHVGGRLQVVDDRPAASRGSIPPGATMPRQAGFDWKLGRPSSTRSSSTAVAERMADALVAALTARPLPHDVEHLYLTDPIAGPRPASTASCSPAASANTSTAARQRDFGDMGRRLGRAMRKRLDAGALPWPLLPAGECIRATALGASEYSVQLSGNTSYISEPGELLPRRNLQVLQPPLSLRGDIDAEAARAGDPRAISPPSTSIEGETEVALAFRWRGAPSYERICRVRAKASGAALADAPSSRASRSTSCSTATSRRRSARILREELRRRERNSGASTASCCGTSTTSTSAASACLPTRCR